MGKSSDIASNENRMRRASSPARKRAVSWLGLFLLSLNILTGALLPQPSLAEMLDIDEAHYIVCTSAGMIEFDEHGQRVPASAAKTGSEICVFCLPLMQGSTHAPAFFVLAEAELTASGAVFPATAAPGLTPVSHSGASGPRAPPAL